MIPTDDRKQVDAFDLGDEYEPDRVLIYETPNGRKEYEAVPFEQARENIFDELGPEFVAMDDYMDEVKRRTDVDGRIQFYRHWTEVTIA